MPALGLQFAPLSKEIDACSDGTPSILWVKKLLEPSIKVNPAGSTAIWYLVPLTRLVPAGNMEVIFTGEAVRIVISIGAEVARSARRPR